MKKTATVRIKGARWEAFASETGSSPDAPASPAPPSATSRLAGSSAKSMLLDLAVRHFRGLQLSAAEAKRLSSALRRCLKGEAVDVGPIGPTGRLYNFRRKANAISIRVGEGCIRLPLDAARALIEPLRASVTPRIPAKAG